MRNPPAISRSVRPRTAALILGAALIAGQALAPAAHGMRRTAVVSLGEVGGTSARPGTARRIVRPHRGLRPRAARSANRIRPRVARAVAVPASGDVWARLRRCESGNRYDVNTGNGFYGAYQFHPRTWRGLGYPGLPHQAPPHVQDEAAQRLQARSGWGQWPVCSRRIGARR